MERLQLIETLIYQFFQPPSNEVLEDALCKLTEWSTSNFVIDDTIHFLSTSSNEQVLFFVARALRGLIHTQWKFFTAEITVNLINFIQNYELSHNERQENPSHRFLLLCLADFSILNKEVYPIENICSVFPANLQIELCTLYFEEWLTKFYSFCINLSYFPVPDNSLQFVNSLLQNNPLSKEWALLYRQFALGLSSFHPLISFYPKLQEATKFLELNGILIDHISDVYIFDMNKGPEYHFVMANLAVQLSAVLREAIEANPQQFKLADNLNLLWASVFSLEDSEEYFLKPEYLQITINLINEFLNAEKVLIASVQISNDLEIWPNLMLSAMRFCENFEPGCQIGYFAVDVLEFILTGLHFGVELVNIHEKLGNFYSDNKDLLNQYLINPRLKFPCILYIVGYLNPTIPKDIQDMYCREFQSFNAPPPIQIYFAKSYVDKDPQYAANFISVFTTYFDQYPYECTQGFFLLIVKFPQILAGSNIIEQFSAAMNNIPFFNQDFLIPLIIFLLMGTPSEAASRFYISIGQITIHSFAEAIQSQNKVTLIEFFRALHRILERITTNLNVVYESYQSANINVNYEEFDRVFENFGQQIFNFIANNLQNVWMDDTQEIQYVLSVFIFDFFQMNFIANPVHIANWLNQIIVVAPYCFQIRCLIFLKDHLQSLPNVLAFIQNLDGNSKDFIYELMVTLRWFALEGWDKALIWSIVPPRLAFGALRDDDKNCQNCSMLAMTELVPTQEPEFCMQVLQTTAQAFATVYKNPLTKEFVELIFKLTKVIDCEVILQTFRATTPMADEDAAIFFQFLQSVTSQELTEEQYATIANKFKEFLSSFLSSRTREF